MTDNVREQASTRHLVAPELLPALDIFPRLELSEASLAAMRSPAPGQRGMPQPPLSPAQQAIGCTPHFVPAADGAPDVRVLVYTPPGAATGRPAYLHMHGGGFILGMPEINDGLNRSTAAEQDCVVVSVDYRLSPETRHPGGLEDCYAALCWVQRAAQTLGIDPARIAIGGESAGGYYAASLALLARDRGGPPICLQLLDSAALDDRTGSSRPAHPICGEFVWTAAHNRFAWSALLGMDPGGDDVPASAAPARARDLTRLPPAFIAIGGLDLFLEENLDYARRLIRAGVVTELHVIPGAYHGFGFAGDTVPQVHTLLRTRAGALARAFAASPAHTDQLRGSRG